MVQAALDSGKSLGDEDGHWTHSAGDDSAANERGRMSTAVEPRTPSLYDMFNEILQEKKPGIDKATSSTAHQLDCYLSEVPIPGSDNPLAYWRANQGRFLDLAQMARRYVTCWDWKEIKGFIYIF